MATDHASADLLYAEFDRAVIRFGVLIAGAWLFALFSCYLSKTSGADWFSRSGSVNPARKRSNSLSIPPDRSTSSPTSVT
jgi:hypothetical protein